jgi:L-ascorbate metabolism protein UlaG (beta-lactamase superfamily)
MNNGKVYLRQNVQLEPLFNQWYAWPLLIAPATAAMNIANSHLKIMKSYVMAPQIHAAANKNPAMRGGPFIDYDGKRVDEIKALMEKTVKEQADKIKFAEAVAAANELLANEAKGYSLEPLYASLPEALKGYVELGYDLNNNPSVRFIENLLYESPLYDPSLQSLALSTIDQDERAFVFSTPRLADDKNLHLRLPFNHEGIDRLFKMREEPQPRGYIEEVLGLDGGQAEKFSAFLSAEGPPKARRYDGDGVRVRYYGHACILVETKEVSILTDPVISYSYHNPFFRYTYVDLPEVIDYVLITHSHADHLMFESLLQLRHKIGQIVVPRNGGGYLQDPSLKTMLRKVGFKNVVEVDEMETVEIPGGGITAVPFLGEHADLSIRTKTAHLIRLLGKSVMCAADSANIEPKLYEHVHKVTGDVDVLFLGMECDGAPLTWVYGSLLTKPVDRKMDHSRKLSGSDCDRGMGIVGQLNCKHVYVYAMGAEPWLDFVTSIKYDETSKQIVESNKLVDACRGRGIESERLYGVKELFL